MAISKNLKHRIIASATQLVNNGAIITTILREVDIPFEKILSENMVVATKWMVIIDYADNNGFILPVIDALIVSQPGNKEIKELRDEVISQDYTQILETLKEIIKLNNCVLFLGPDLLTCREGNEMIPFHKYVASELAKYLNSLNVFFDTEQKNNLSYLIDRFESRKNFLEGQTEFFISNLYDKCDIDLSIFRLINELKFSLIINANPDIELSKLFPDTYIPYYYNFADIRPGVIKPLEDGQCILYNVYGSFQNKYSLVLTEKDSVEYTKNVYEKNPPIPIIVSEQVKRSFGFFLGFNYSDWHLKILFDVLSLKEKPDNFSVCDFSSIIPESQREYFEKQFKITFLKNSILQVLKSLK